MGNPFVHLDLACDDIAAAQKFYKAVFDWKYKKMPGMDYVGIDVGTGVGGGIGTKNMPGQPTAWTAYVDVKSVKATIAKAQKAGAQILVPFQPIGDMGALGVFLDPQGAAIGVWESTKKPEPKKAAAKKPAAKKPAAKKPAAKKKPAKKK